jgi:hypothetical protein
MTQQFTIPREVYEEFRDFGVDYNGELVFVAIDFNTDTQEYEMRIRHPTIKDI